MVYPKTFVKVRADFFPDGQILPLRFRAENGPAYTIDRIDDITQMANTRGGGQGLRYTCRVQGQVIYLFHDRSRWFVDGVMPF